MGYNKNKNMSKISERSLALALRVKIIDCIGEIDLPWFLFEEIDGSLNELNYFKLSNLFDNISAYNEYLSQVAEQYSRNIHALQKKHGHASNRHENHEPYMTDSLYNEGFTISLSKKQLVILRSLYCVSCNLTMKEYINRRILQKSRIKQKTMSSAVV